MVLPMLLLVGHALTFAPVPEPRFHLPLTDGQAEWYQAKHGPTDQYGDPLPEGAFARIGTSRFCPNSNVLALAFSPDGRMMASAGHAGVHLWDTVSGKPLALFTPSKLGGFYEVAFLPRGKYLVSKSWEGRLLFWELNPNQKRPLRGPEADFSSNFVLSGNGQRLAFVKNGAIRLWDVSTGQEAARLEFSRKTTRLALSADGKWLAADDDNAVMLWDVAAGKVLRSFRAPEVVNPRQPAGLLPEKPVLHRFALSADGEILAALITAERQPALHIWEAQTGKKLHVQPLEDRAPGPLAFSPDGKVLALAGDKGLRLWEARTGQLRRAIPAYGGQITSLAFSPDGCLLATGHYFAVKLWDVKTGQEKTPEPALQNRLGYISLSADGRTLVTAAYPTTGLLQNEDGPDAPVLRFWDAASGKRRPSLWDAKKHFPPFADLSADQSTLAT